MKSANILSDSKEFKSCAGRDCKQPGIHEIRIKYIHKVGWFCESCKNNLIEQKLTEDHNECEVPQKK